MFPFFETLKVRNGLVFNLEGHQERVNRTFKHHFLDEKYSSHQGLSLRKALVSTLNEIPKDNLLYRVRIDYDHSSYNIQYFIYKSKIIRSLKTIECGDADYSYKYTDRQFLEHLFSQKEACDDILIMRNGFICDTSYSNVVFYDGSHWFTPTTYLLRGTKREHLVTKKLIREIPIHLDDLPAFKTISLINSMLDIGDIELLIKNIY